MSTAALLRIPVGVVVERCKAKSPLIDFIWRPVSVLVGHPSAAPWTLLRTQGESVLFYAGGAMIELYRTETANYRINLASGTPSLWVVLRAGAAEPCYELVSVTADPAEGEAFTDAGSDLVDTVPMPASIAGIVADFVAEHHVDRPFVRRRRDPVEPRTAAFGRVKRKEVE
jgi:hypothetical protein